MSVLQVSNIWFESTGTKRFGLDGPDNVTLTTDLTITGNINADFIGGDGSNVRNLTANADVSAPFNQANTAYAVLNASFTRSNIVFGISNSAFGAANVAFTQANLVFDVANATFSVANGYGANIAFANTIANLAYQNANTVGIAFAATNAAFLRANTIYVFANNAGNTANFENRAVAAFGAVNAAFTRSNTIYLIANNASNTANFENRAVAAFAASNIVFNAANAAFAQANIAIANTNFVNTMAIASFAQSNLVFNTANAAFAEANLSANITTIISNTSIGTGTTYTITSSNITRAYRVFDMWIRRASHNNAANQTLQILFSTNNGTTTAGPFTIGGSVNAADEWFLNVRTVNAELTGTNAFRICLSVGGYTTAAQVWGSSFQVAATGSINWIRIQPSAGNFDGGTVTLYGWE